jgi:hypothetical protein
MPQFLLLATYAPDTGPQEGTPDHAQEMRHWDRFNAAVEESGDLVWSLALEGPRARATVPTDIARDSGDQHVVFAQYLLEAPDIDHATTWAQRMPVVEYGAVEVHPVLAHRVCSTQG